MLEVGLMLPKKSTCKVLSFIGSNAIAIFAYLERWPQAIGTTDAGSCVIASNDNEAKGSLL
ncbi:hypothetical protein [Shewanella sp. MBTL60-007]|uniref:hypothetical protein n=1 Tax=Shewanella sp. MBTL60-007 TaxID=2815911 RepID=UPI001C8209D7|nr:hypothetical protein [Shewanella sp. MBTL60-007]